MGRTNEEESDKDADRLRRRAQFLRELAEARELRARVTPRRTRLVRLRELGWLRSYLR